MFFVILFYSLICVYVCIWIHRCMLLLNFSELVKNNNGFNTYDPGYNLSCSASEREIENSFKNTHIKRVFYFTFFFSILVLPISALLFFKYYKVSEDVFIPILSSWVVVYFFVEHIFENLMVALRDRAYLVLRQKSEYSILLDKELSDKVKVEIIRNRRERHDQEFY